MTLPLWFILLAVLTATSASVSSSCKSARDQLLAPESFGLSFDRFVGAYKLTFVNKTGRLLIDVNVTIMTTREDGGKNKVGRYWATWQASENKEVTITGDSKNWYLKVESVLMEGTAFLEPNARQRVQIGVFWRM